MRRRVQNCSGSEKGQMAESCKQWVLILCVLKNAGNFVNIWRPVSFSRCLLVHEVSRSVSKLYSLFAWLDSRSGHGPPHCGGCDIRLRHTTLGRRVIGSSQSPYQTTHITYKRQVSIPPAGFEPAIPASVRLHRHAATGFGTYLLRNN
jgi:hypothetical protein